MGGFRGGGPPLAEKKEREREGGREREALMEIQEALTEIQVGPNNFILFWIYKFYI